MKDIAICTIAYNRDTSLARLLKSLSVSKYSTQNVTLYISIDRSDNDKVYQVASNFNWSFGKKEIITHTKNLGLKQHVLKCGDLLEKHDALIVLEDDIVVSPFFFEYASSAVNFYNEDLSIAGISLYSFEVNYNNGLPFTPLVGCSDVFFMNIAQSWGQVWLKKQWFDFKEWLYASDSKFDNNKHLPNSICSWSEKSWLKHHTKYCIENNKYFVYPYTSLSTNFSDQGTHVSSASSLMQVALLSNYKEFRFENITTDSICYDAFFENKCPIRSAELDLYGTKVSYICDKVISSRILDYEVVESFGLQMRPHESNILYGVEGNDLYLYNLRKPLKQSFSLSNRLSYVYNRSVFYYKINIEFYKLIIILIYGFFCRLRTYLKI